MLPPSAIRKPSTHSTVLVFPAPFGPTIPNISPWYTSKEILSTATTGPYVFLRCSTSITAFRDIDSTFLIKTTCHTDKRKNNELCFIDVHCLAKFPQVLPRVRGTLSFLPPLPRYRSAACY